MAMQVSVIQKQILKDSKNINSFNESSKELFILGHIFKWKIPPTPTPTPQSFFFGGGGSLYMKSCLSLLLLCVRDEWIYMIQLERLSLP